MVQDIKTLSRSKSDDLVPVKYFYNVNFPLSSFPQKEVSVLIEADMNGHERASIESGKFHPAHGMCGRIDMCKLQNAKS